MRRDSHSAAVRHPVVTCHRQSRIPYIRKSRGEVTVMSPSPHGEPLRKVQKVVHTDGVHTDGFAKELEALLQHYTRANSKARTQQCAGADRLSRISCDPEEPQTSTELLKLVCRDDRTQPSAALVEGPRGLQLASVPETLPPPPKRFYRTFWRMLAKRVLQQETN